MTGARWQLEPAEVAALVSGIHGDPFARLGVHKAGSRYVARAVIPDAETVAAAGQALCDRADRKDEPFFASRGFDGSRGFYDRFLRLGVVFVWSEAANGAARAALWVNRSARIALPAPAARACLARLRGP